MYKQCQLIIEFTLSNHNHYIHHPSPPSSLLSYIPLYSLYTLTGNQALGVKGTVLYNCGVELGVYD